MVITRFAPSPTGNLHIGGARTALFNWLFAKNKGGKFLIRIEDTDKERSEDRYTQNIIDSLDWLGINYDDQIFFQSQRLDKYQQAINKLLHQGNAYYCNCSKNDLDILRKSQEKAGIKPKYDGRNRNANLAYKEGFVVRFKTPLEGKVTIKDTLKGEVSVQCEELDDLIIQRSDGNPTYNLAVVVDDIDMGITNIIRGDDHLNNTFRQYHLMNALNYKIPEYTHIPLILGEDRKRLSKRHGAVSTYDYKKEGFLPLAIINYLVRLGWASGNKEKFTIEELIDLFDLDHLNKSSSIFDYKKLYSINKYFIKESHIDDLYKEFIYITSEFKMFDKTSLAEIINVQRDRCKTVKEIIDESRFFLPEKLKIDEKLAKKYFVKENLALFNMIEEKLNSIDDWTTFNVNALIDNIMGELNITTPEFAKPIRVALTGSLSSPSIDKVIYMLGKELCISRISYAKTNFA